jgi:hypothetical protein
VNPVFFDKKCCILENFISSINSIVRAKIMKPFPNLVYPVVALNSALRFIKPLPIEERPLKQCHLLDQSMGDL